MALCSYKYKVDNYDAIVNDSSIKKGIIYGVYYDCKANTHDFFTCEYALMDPEVKWIKSKEYHVIASNFNPENVGPSLHDKLPAACFNTIMVEDENWIQRPIVDTKEFIVAFYPDDRSKLISFFNDYLNKQICRYHAAKL